MTPTERLPMTSDPLDSDPLTDSHALRGQMWLDWLLIHRELARQATALTFRWLAAANLAVVKALPDNHPTLPVERRNGRKLLSAAQLLEQTCRDDSDDAQAWAALIRRTS